jgi:hypothetical protein
MTWRMHIPMEDDVVVDVPRETEKEMESLTLMCRKIAMSQVKVHICSNQYSSIRWMN